MKARGFTLIEMVLTMVVGSILILGIAGFVELGSRGYADTVDRQRIQTQARFVLEKMTREIRHAVPNSFRAENNCISFYPIVYSGFYSVDGQDNRKLSFIIGNSSYDLSDSNSRNLIMIINPTYADEFDESEVSYSGIDLSDYLDVDSMTLSFLPPLKSQSVANRFYIYNQYEQVKYCIDSREILRNNVQVADSVSSAAFSYAPPTLQRGGVVHLSLIFEQNGESSSFETDVQVLNVP